MLAKTLFFRTEQRRLVLIFFSTDSDHDCDENIAFNCYPQGARQSPRKVPVYMSLTNTTYVFAFGSL